ncbi:MAG: hypothetical protein II482_03580, partial [Lachnospiraceae bacterium]|nr:hypothetical protein [Lachnospiraceae bacterium]
FDHYLVSVKNPQVSDETFGEWVDKEQDCFALDRWIDALIMNNELTKNEDGIYTITVSACDEDGQAIAKSSVTYSYESSAEPVVVGTITGLTWNADTRILSWDAYYEDPNGHTLCDYAYTIQYDANHSESWYIEEPQADLTDALESLRENGKISKGDEVAIYVTAYTRIDPDDPESDRITIAKTDGSDYIMYTYEPFEIGTITPSFSDGYLVWDAFEGAAGYDIAVNDQHGTYFWADETMEWSEENIGQIIDAMIRRGELAYNEEGSYTVTLTIKAEDDNYRTLAKGSIDYAYTTDMKPVEQVEITNFQEDSNRILTWDPVEGAQVYYYSVSGTDAAGTEILTPDYSEYRVESAELDLIDVFVELNEKYSYELEEGLPLTINISAEGWDGTIYGSGSWDTTYSSWEVTELPASIDGNGNLGWAPVTGVDHYTLTIDYCSKDYPKSTIEIPLNETIDLWLRTGNIYESIKDRTEHEITLVAKDAMGRPLERYHTSEYAYTSGVTYGDLMDVDITGIAYDEETGILSWDEVPGAFTYKLSIYGWDSEESTAPQGSVQDLTDTIGWIEVGETITVEVKAFNNNSVEIGNGSYELVYGGARKLKAWIEDDGELTWSQVIGANSYRVVVGDPEDGYSEDFDFDDQPADLQLLIDKASAAGFYLPEGENTWPVTVYAIEKDEYGYDVQTLSTWTGTYAYEPMTIQPLDASIDEGGMLTWHSVEGAGGYNLYVTWRNGGLSEEPTMSMPAYGSQMIDINRVIDNQLTAGYMENLGTFYVMLTATDARDEDMVIAEWSQNYKYTSEAVPFVQDIKNFRVTDKTLQWDAVEGAATYKVVYFDSTSDLAEESGELTAPSFDISGIINEESTNTKYYYFTVFAYDEEGQKVGRGETQYRYPEGEAIQSIELTGIDSTLSKGGPVVFSEDPKTDDENKAFVQSEKWTSLQDEDDFFVGFETIDEESIPTPGSTYRYSIQLSAEEGYHFTDDMTITCNGKTYMADELSFEFFDCGTTVLITGLLDDITIEKTTLSREDVYVGYGVPGSANYKDLADRTYLYDQGFNESFLQANMGVFLKEDPSVMLKPGTDYTIAYDVESADQTATVTFIGEYTGTAVVPMSAAKVTVSVPVVKFQKSGSGDVSHGEKVAITKNGVEKVLTYGKDYGAGYMMGASNIGEGHILAIWGLGDYIGWLEGYTYKVVGDLTDTENSTTTVTIPTLTYTGKALTPKPTVKFTAFKETKTLTNGTDYTVTYKNSAGTVVTAPVKVGTYKAVIKGKGLYTGEKTVSVKVVPAATSSVTVTNLAKGTKVTWKKVTGATGYYVYRNGKQIKKITSGSTVSYTDTAANTNGTKYTYKIVAYAASGKSTLSKSKTFYRVSRPAISSLTSSAAGKMTVKWGKNTKATGYEIQYSKSKTFASGNKTATVTRNSTVSKVISSLTKGKTYYVRVRTYKTVSGTKYYSAWSVVKSVKVKK